jgi:hypothetical protein
MDESSVDKFKKEINVIVNNIEDVVFNRIDLSDGPDKFEMTMIMIANELFDRYLKTENGAKLLKNKITKKFY